jgi:hypothetical protein
MNYQPLEPDSLRSVGVAPPTFDGNTSFYATTSFLYTLFFVAIIGAAFYRYMLAGILRMQASDTAIRNSNETFRKTTLGLLGVFSLFLILVTFNKDLVTGDIGLGDLASKNMETKPPPIAATPPSPAVGAPGAGSSGGSVSRSCESKDDIIRKAGGAGICSGTTCTALSGCNYLSYLPIIDANTGGDTNLKKMIIVTMCKESKANPNAKNTNPNGTYDCGLMQINQSSPCPTNPSQAEQEANIKVGISKMKQKIAYASQVYPNIPAVTGAFSSYNCCANGTIPNAPSTDCTVAAGFPFTLPKWACPINPGDGQYNMCVVKNYACDLAACMNKL